MPFDLHKLGWHEFQDLTGIVLQEVLGQTLQVFADSNDGGRDGAFYGSWVPTEIDLGSDGPLVDDRVTVQCKHSTRPSGTLTPSELRDELAKVQRLHEEGLCDTYIVCTNLRVTGTTDEWLRSACAELGVSRTKILGGQWLCQQIQKRPALRRNVPRVYGLGDLSLILDDRRQQQSERLLSHLADDLATFVPTDAYRRASDALLNRSFVLLLGQPASGKSTIAAVLAMTALDQWGCEVMRVNSAEELIDHWNPNDQERLFWVDDAFGTIRHETSLTESWARRMDQIMACIKGGNRVILTSRDYIYREARLHLKEHFYSRLHEQQVVIDLHALTPAERRRILYNHLRAGDQQKKVLDLWKPWLEDCCDVEPFLPEVARRLSKRRFTTDTRLDTAQQLRDFFKHPTEVLQTTLAELEPASRAALACVYLTGDELPTPVILTAPLLEVTNRIGATEPDVLAAFDTLKGTFLTLHADSDGEQSWQFSHPTIREGFAAYLGSDPNHLPGFLQGLTDTELLRQVDCGSGSTAGTLIRIPPSLYHLVIPRVGLPTDRRLGWNIPFSHF